MNNMEEEAIENRRKRLKYRSWHRGTREMDLLMGTFADAFLPDCSEEELEEYEQILQYNDPDLYNWITGQAEAPANIITPVMEKLLGHSFSQ